MDNLVYILFWGAIGYLLGSIPFGLLLTKWAGYGDIRKIGSGNIGATNVLRTGNKFLALLTVLLDAFKAAFAAWLAYRLTPEIQCRICGLSSSLSLVASLIAGTCGILGHMFPCWLKFKGGKGVSSAFGLLLVTCPVVAGIALFAWILMAVIFRYSSLAALTAAVVVIPTSFFLASNVHFYFFTFIVLIVIIKHHANISRLIKGEESKITFSKKKTVTHQKATQKNVSKKVIKKTVRKTSKKAVKKTKATKKNVKKKA